MNDSVNRNRQQQAQLYGQPLGELLGTVGQRLGLNQARLAKTLGVSAPMLSQLMNGQRAKLGNPAAVQRLQALVELAGEAPVDPAILAERLSQIEAQSAALTTGSSTASRPNAAGAARTVQGLLRAIAGAEEVLEAAALLDDKHPELAEFLRAYGVGRTGDAVGHYTAHQHLL